MDALSAAIFAGRLATPGGDLFDVARTAGSAPRPRGARVSDLLLDGTAAAFRDGYAAGLPTLRKVLSDFGATLSAEEELPLLWMASTTAMRLWDADRWEALSARHVQLARKAGALGELALALISRAYRQLFAGDLIAAASLIDEAQAVNDATGSNLAPYGPLALAAFRGNQPDTISLVEATKQDATRRGEGIGITFAEWANAVLNNGLGRYQEATAAAERACGDTRDSATTIWPAVELIEAATRSGMTEAAHDAYERLSVTSASGTDWALGIQARSHALISEGAAAEHLYCEAIAHLDKTRLRVDLARAHLLYGEWLRRERRRTDARERLRTAHTMFEGIGMTAFSERSRRELQAAGGTTRKRVTAEREELTAQEIQIARMASGGLSNPEIATRLFISARTVQYHLRKVFTKLGITSRSQLEHVLPDLHL